MNIWVDADACPVPIKEILYRAANRVQIVTTLIANSHLTIPASPYIKFVRVPSGFDIADHEIVQRCQSGDLVITSDIPLAAEVIEKGGKILSPRGDVLTPENIRNRLSMRDFMETLRGSGIQTGGPAAFHQRDKQNFANQLDQFLRNKP